MNCFCASDRSSLDLLHEPKTVGVGDLFIVNSQSRLVFHKHRSAFSPLLRPLFVLTLKRVYLEASGGFVTEGGVGKSIYFAF